MREGVDGWGLHGIEEGREAEREDMVARVN